MQNYGRVRNPVTTPQSQAIPGRSDMAQNNAGGFGWQANPWDRLKRFLILGVEGSTIYVQKRELQTRNLTNVEACIKENGPLVVNTVVEISKSGRAPKNDPALAVLAMCMKYGDDATRRAAYLAVPAVARIGTHLFHLAEYMDQFGCGWGRGKRNAIGRWYDGMDPNRLALQLVKYQQRDGWSHRDMLRLSHPSKHERGGETDQLLAYATGKLSPELLMREPDNALRLVYAHEQAKQAGDAREIMFLINDYGLPRESIPTQFLNDPKVWEALLDNRGRGMPMTALVRNLAKMTSIGLIRPNDTGTTSKVVQLLTNKEAIRYSRIHPLQALVALNTYGRGRGVRGSLTWSPVQKIKNALDRLFYASFGNVESTGLRYLLALDVSGSMSGPEIANMPGVSPRIGSAAMALVTAAAEEEHHIVGFTSSGSGWGSTRKVKNFWASPNQRSSWGAGGVTALDIHPRQRLDDVVKEVSGLPFGGTDCALPMLYALDNNIPVDMFVIYTDSETWAGGIHPKQALDKYRKKMGIDARMVVVGMTSNGFTIADPEDKGMLDVVGFDTATPNLIAGFAKGEF
jgi:60 kDa SS-A/Ro ribonucleoprotein